MCAFARSLHGGTLESCPLDRHQKLSTTLTSFSPSKLLLLYRANNYLQWVAGWRYVITVLMLGIKKRKEKGVTG